MLDFGDESPAGEALEIVQGLLDGTRGSDDDLADSASAADPRAVATIREFLELLASNEAVCALEFNERASRFRDVGEVRRAAARLNRENLREEQSTLRGEFLGVLPEARRFEFKISVEGEVIRGKIGPGVADPSSINRHLHRPTEISVMATQVGSGKPRYKSGTRILSGDKALVDLCEMPSFSCLIPSGVMNSSPAGGVAPRRTLPPRQLAAQ